MTHTCHSYFAIAGHGMGDWYLVRGVDFSHLYVILYSFPAFQ